MDLREDVGKVLEALHPGLFKVGYSAASDALVIMLPQKAKNPPDPIMKEGPYLFFASEWFPGKPIRLVDPYLRDYTQAQFEIYMLSVLPKLESYLHSIKDAWLILEHDPRLVYHDGGFVAKSYVEGMPDMPGHRLAAWKLQSVYSVHHAVGLARDAIKDFFEARQKGYDHHLKNDGILSDPMPAVEFSFIPVNPQDIIAIVRDVLTIHNLLENADGN